jgi:diaminohydroxyphosphoribosylaminopyrimidine deaminase/5-amino-6-(5-phosphoribosylamino)uracil reductase
MNPEAVDEFYMLECLALARRGAGSVSPNPMVGCVIVKKGTVIGRGYHRRFGGPHAEVNAIRSAGASVRGATLYVNLEPCSHHGKTPPCTDLIIRSKVARVVIGTIDQNPLVSGEGIRRLRRAGVSVTVDLLEDESVRLNEFFFKYIRTRMPFVTLKVAQTLDGKITGPNGSPRWITGPRSRSYVHTLRSHYDAVMVGAGTVLADNPRLTVRNGRGRDPIRIVLDGKFRLKPEAAVFRNARGGMAVLLVERNSLVRHSSKADLFMRKGVRVIGIPGRRNGRVPLGRVLRLLGSQGISSLLVEGGASLFSGFVSESKADKLLLFIAPSIFGTGLDAFRGLAPRSRRRPARIRTVSLIQMGEDTLLQGYLVKAR